MGDSVPRILARLAPISDKVILTPLREGEISALEAAVELPMPLCLREYLSNVGLFEDLTLYDTCEFEILDNVDRFPEDRQFLVQHFGLAAAKLFPFAGDGAGNYVAVADEASGAKLFFADHETHKIREIGDFSEWLSSVVDAALKKERPGNSIKRWCVQFSFRAASPDSILVAIRQLGSVSLGEWSEPQVFPSKVHSYQAPLDFNNERLTLKRSEFWTWEQPRFSLDYGEPATLEASASMIRKLDAAFRQARMDYKLVDYGPLALDWRKDELGPPQERSVLAKLWNRVTRPW